MIVLAMQPMRMQYAGTLRLPRFRIRLCGVTLLAVVSLLSGCVSRQGARAGISGEPESARALAFIHVTVIDGTGGTPREGMTVVIRGGNVIAVGPEAGVRVPAGARVVDARGKYLIPGLWDMHEG